jgi:hypothetical protein
MTIRKTVVYEDSKWVPGAMKDLVVGDLFKLYDVEGGHEVLNLDVEHWDKALAADALVWGNEVYRATTTPYLNDEGIWTIYADIVETT